MPVSLIGAPEGARDRLFAAAAARRAMEARVAALFSRRGFREVMTPAVERYELFIKAGRPLPEETMLKTIDRHGRILVLRPDSTTPMARVAAARLKNLPPPLRLYYIQDVFRCGAPHTGQMLETRQAGVELIGAGGVRADLEMLSLAAQTLLELTGGDWRLELGHAGLFSALAQALPADGETREELRALIEQKNFASLADALSPFGDHPAARGIGRLCRLFGGSEVFSDAGSFGLPEADAALAELSALFAALEQAGFAGQIQLDFGLVGELDYYTGVIFRGYAAGAGAPVLSGGRYDTLLSALGDSAPAVGFAADLDALCALRAPLPEAADAVLIHFSPDTLGAALRRLDARPGSILSPCSTREESLALARLRGIKTVIDVAAGTEETL